LIDLISFEWFLIAVSIIAVKMSMQAIPASENFRKIQIGKFLSILFKSFAE